MYCTVWLHFLLYANTFYVEIKNGILCQRARDLTESIDSLEIVPNYLCRLFIPQRCVKSSPRSAAVLALTGFISVHCIYYNINHAISKAGSCL